jgi:hypothetical protein
MEIRIVRQERLRPYMERWLLELAEHDFRAFGFYLEALEGVGLHRKSKEGDNLLEVDVATGRKDELLALLADLANEP